MLWTGLSKYSNLGLLIIRVGLGVAFVLHGMGMFKGGEETLRNVGAAMANFGIPGGYYAFGVMAGLTQMIGGLLLVLGAFFRPACLMLLWVMTVALIMHLRHGDSFMVYSHAMEAWTVFLGLLLIGPGKISVDGK